MAYATRDKIENKLIQPLFLKYSEVLFSFKAKPGCGKWFSKGTDFLAPKKKKTSLALKWFFLAT